MQDVWLQGLHLGEHAEDTCQLEGQEEPCWLVCLFDVQSPTHSPSPQTGTDTVRVLASVLLRDLEWSDRQESTRDVTSLTCWEGGGGDRGKRGRERGEEGRGVIIYTLTFRLGWFSVPCLGPLLSWRYHFTKVGAQSCSRVSSSRVSVLWPTLWWAPTRAGTWTSWSCWRS